MLQKLYWPANFRAPNNTVILTTLGVLKGAAYIIVILLFIIELELKNSYFSFLFFFLIAMFNNFCNIDGLSKTSVS